MAQVSEYVLVCECGKELRSHEKSGECSKCGREFEIQRDEVKPA